MHRAISGDLQNEEEMDRAMEETGEEGIYQVKTPATWTDIRTKYSVFTLIFCIITVRKSSDLCETLILDSACMCVCLSSVLMVCLAIAWTHSPLSQTTCSPNRWPTSGHSSSQRASLSLRRALPWCPPLTFSPQRHQKVTLTTMHLQSECQNTHVSIKESRWHVGKLLWWVIIFVLF